MDTPLIFAQGRPGRRGYRPAAPAAAVDPSAILPAGALRAKFPKLPEVSELQVVRHYTRLSQKNYSVDTHFYPLGSCTMKYNPKLHERVARRDGFARLHPLAPDAAAQGTLEALWDVERWLCALTGMSAFTLQPAAGAHGELTALLMLKAYHHDHGGARGHGNGRRRVIIVPDSAHGTNPASAAMAGFEVRTVPSDARGLVDPAALAAVVGPDTAGMMLTNPNTLGLFEVEIKKIAGIIHQAGGLLYYDGANFNAVAGVCRPGDMGFDLVHLNVHKTMTTPHGGGGPGAGPLGASARLAPYLPGPRVKKSGRRFAWQDGGRQSIGRMKAFHGNVGILVRAYAYLRHLGAQGLADMARHAVLNARYLQARLTGAGGGTWRPASAEPCMHEFVLSLAPLKAASGLRAVDFAKRILDEGFYAPTVAFPLIVPEALMVEPTETEPKEVLDEFADAMGRIAAEALIDPEALTRAPRTTPVGRLDEVSANRTPLLRA